VYIRGIGSKAEWALSSTFLCFLCTTAHTSNIPCWTCLSHMPINFFIYL